jgi:hypothetical protein
VVLADHGNDEGKSIYPSQSTIARKTSMTRPGVNKIIKSLEEKGFIEKVKKRDSGVFELEINTETLESSTVTPPVTYGDTPLSPTITPPVTYDDTNHQLTKDSNPQIKSKATPSLLSNEELARLKEKDEKRLQGMRERIPLASLLQKREAVLQNIGDYPADVQDIIKSFCRHWKMPPPPRNSKQHSKWCKDGKDIKKLLVNAQLSEDIVFDEAYYIWKTPPEHINVSRKQYQGKFMVKDLGSVSNLVWLAISNILSGQSKRRTKTYYDAEGRQVLVDKD